MCIVIFEVVIAPIIAGVTLVLFKYWLDGNDD